MSRLIRAASFIIQAKTTATRLSSGRRGRLVRWKFGDRDKVKLINTLFEEGRMPVRHSDKFRITIERQ